MRARVAQVGERVPYPRLKGRDRFRKASAVKQHEIDEGEREGLSTDEREQLGRLRRLWTTQQAESFVSTLEAELVRAG